MDIPAAFADIALGFSSVMGGPYHAARIVNAGEPIFDSGGSIVTPGTPTQRTCMAQVDTAGERMRAQDGFAEGDMSILVLASTLAGAISTDDRVEVLAGPHTGTYSIESVARDSVGIGFELRGRKA